MPHQRKNMDFNPHGCGVTHFLKRIGGQWKVLVVHGISMKVNRFTLLQKAIPNISKQSLANAVRELEADKIIERIVAAQEPAKIEYKLTGYGESLLPVIRYIDEWGKNDMKRLEVEAV